MVEATLPPRLTYGITPPKHSLSAEQRETLARRQTQRIAELPIDALVVYDLQDESSRTQVPRPFPFLQTVDPLEYATEDLAELSVPKVVYRSVSQLDAAGLGRWMRALRAQGGATVFVGAPSRDAKRSLRLSEAQALRGAEAPDLQLGGVVIAERHRQRGGEDERVLHKRARGCSFFISQAVYDVTATKDLLSDLYFRCQAAGQPMPHLLVTLCPCGSTKTLEFLAWLGIDVPRWIQNELHNAGDPLQTSVDTCIATFRELWQFAADKGFSLGCNVESVSVRKAEIDASVAMIHQVARIMGRS